MRLLSTPERLGQLVIVGIGLVAVLFFAGAGSACVYAIWKWALNDSPCLL